MLEIDVIDLEEFMTLLDEILEICCTEKKISRISSNKVINSSKSITSISSIKGKVGGASNP
jgi:hypothetical protein